MRYQNSESGDEHTFYVDPAVERQGRYVFRSLQEALGHITDGGEREPMRIYLLPGVYWLHDPEDEGTVTAMAGDPVPFGMKIKCRNLQLIGLGESPRDVVIAANRGQSHGAMGNYTMFQVVGDDFFLSNLTVGNYCSVDLVYERDRSLDRARRTDAVTQAQIGFVEGDRFYADHCRFIGRLNLVPFCGAERSLYVGCHFEMTDDSLNSHAVYLGCDFDFHGSRPIFQSLGTGVVFLDCEFRTRLYPDGAEHTQYFTKEGGPVAVVDCRFPDDGGTRWKWTKYPSDDLKCYIAGRKQNPVFGLPDASTVIMDGNRILDAYRYEKDSETVYNIYNLLGGRDGWDALRQRGYGAEYCGLPTFLKIDGCSDTVSSDSGENRLVMTAYALDFCGVLVPVSISWEMEAEPGSRAFAGMETETDGNRCILTGCNDSEEIVPVTIHARTPEGLEAAKRIRILPSTLEPPAIAESPYITWEQGAYTVHCRLNLDGHRDESSVEWYRIEDVGHPEPVLVAHGRKGEPLWSYRPSIDDEGCGIRAVIRPKHNRSPYGEAVIVQRNFTMPRDGFPRGNVIEPDLPHFPLKRQTKILPGCWTVDQYCPEDFAEKYTCEADAEAIWKYGTTGNGSVGEGIYQAVQGARLLYTPKRQGQWQGMSVCLWADPAKTAGQGFGRAGQYMDIALGMDTARLSGWALRIGRTREVSDGAAACLVRYENGLSYRISEEILTSAFITGCEIKVSLFQGFLEAVMTVKGKRAEAGQKKKYADSVKLGAAVSAQAGQLQGGAMILHTGTVGTGGWQNTTMLHKIKICYSVPVS